MSLDLSELRELLTAINQTDFAELILKSDDFELTVRRGGPMSMGPLPPPIATQVPGAPQPGMPAPPISTPEPAKPVDSGNGPAVSPIVDRRLVDITSPIVGTFYRAPGPDEPPFVEVGTRIQKGQTVCIIEAMKVMNELEAEVAGEVVEVLLKDGQPVEYGQPLMRVNPI